MDNFSDSISNLIIRIDLLARRVCVGQLIQKERRQLISEERRNVEKHSVMIRNRELGREPGEHTNLVALLNKKFDQLDQRSGYKNRIKY